MWNMLSGVIGQPINKWTEALMVKKQLIQDAQSVEDGKKEATTFKTVVIDTVSIAYDQCEKYILDKEGCEYLDETPKMRGYKTTKREFESYFQELVKAGYTVVAIAHSTTVQEKEGNTKYDKITPSIDKRGLEVLSGLCDVIAYSGFEAQDDGSVKTMLYMRARQDLVAGSRNPYMSEKIPFTYEALLADMQQAIDRQEAEGAIVTDAPTEVYKEQTVTRDYKVLKQEIGSLCKKIVKVTNDMETVSTIIEKHLGRDSDDNPRRVVNCTAAQADILELILIDIQNKAKELQIETE